jgi:CheY-like chemotaxis protein
VITDCNMPEMDGYELARAIRDIEDETRQERTTIIACTANALKGESENCFAAGMDDYISKPIELGNLMAKLDHWLPLPGGAPARGDAALRADDRAAVIDRSALREISDGDEALELEILSQFRHANAQDVSALERALAARSLVQVTQAAHRIKGAARSVGAMALADICARVEEAGRAGDAAAVAANEEEFRREARRLEEHLASIAAAAGSSQGS